MPSGETGQFRRKIEDRLTRLEDHGDGPRRVVAWPKALAGILGLLGVTNGAQCAGWDVRVSQQAEVRQAEFAASAEGVVDALLRCRVQVAQVAARCGTEE